MFEILCFSLFFLLIFHSFGLHVCNQEGGGVRREVLYTTEQGAREEEEEGGGGRGEGGVVGVLMPDHSITFLLHFYSGIGKERQKRSAKGKR